MTHPACCAGHSCDFCDLCLSGTCCLTIASFAPAVTTTVTVDQVDRLHDAIAEETASGVGLSQLIQVDVMVRLDSEPAPAALPPAPERVDIFDASEKEASHADAARPLR